MAAKLGSLAPTLAAPLGAAEATAAEALDAAPPTAEDAEATTPPEDDYRSAYAGSSVPSDLPWWRLARWPRRIHRQR